MDRQTGQHSHLSSSAVVPSSLQSVHYDLKFLLLGGKGNALQQALGDNYP